MKELTSRVEEDTNELNKVQKELEDKTTEMEALKESLKNMSVLERAQEAAGDGKTSLFLSNNSSIHYYYSCLCMCTIMFY